MNPKDLIKVDKDNIWHPFTPLQGHSSIIPIDNAKEASLFTKDGKEIIDAVSSWWVNIHGHSNPKIAKAIATQAQTMEHVIFAGFTHEPAIQLSKNLLSILPDNQRKIFFSDDGSTAVEVGIKWALQYWFNQGVPRKKILALDGAYHGDTFGAMSIGGRSMFTEPFNDYLFEVDFIDFPFANHEDQVLDKFLKLVDSQEYAAFIYEPLLQGAGGMRMYSAQFLDRLLAIAKEHDIVCIADEVLTGFGRTGRNFASLHMSQQPDIMALSKGITGGFLPLGVTTCSDKIVTAFDTSDFTKTFFHGHSYTANPISCAAANASYQILISKDCQDNITRITEKHKEFIADTDGHRSVKEVRNIGTVVALELRAEEDTGYDNPLREKIYPYFLEKGILLRPLGNVIYILPPYVITNEQLDQIYGCIHEFLNEIVNQ